MATPASLRNRKADDKQWAQTVGQKVLAGLAKGRQIRIEELRAQSAKRKQLILDLLVVDLASGAHRRGRAGRIAQKLAGEFQLTESYLRKLLSRLQIGRRASPGQNGQNSARGLTHV